MPLQSLIVQSRSNYVQVVCHESYYLLLQASPQNFCPSLRKQQNHSRESFCLSTWSVTMRKLANLLLITSELADKRPQFLLTLGMKMLRSFSLVVRCQWTTLRNSPKISLRTSSHHSTSLIQYPNLMMRMSKLSLARI